MDPLEPRRPTIHAVIEVWAPKALWAPRPDPPSAPFVRLWRGALPGDVAHVVATLATYGHGGHPAQSAAELLADFPDVTPGGLAVLGAGGVAIHPGCCCGLETWPQWLDVTRTGASPWMGHDPAPWIEIAGDDVRVWPDGGLGDPAPRMEPVRFTRAEVDASLARVHEDLHGFLVPLRAWLGDFAPAQARDLVERFRDTFVR